MPKKSTTNAAKAAASAVAASTAEGPVKNCVWSNNNAACVRTWLCLSKKVLGQIDAGFDKAETIRMDKLAYWNDVAPGDNRDVEAKALADVLTKLFTNMLGAKYEAGHTFASALLAMAAVLVVADKTVCELAAVIDETHRFLPEQQT